MVVLIILLVILVKLLAAFLGTVGVPSGVFIAVLAPLIALLWSQRGRRYHRRRGRIGAFQPKFVVIQRDRDHPKSRVVQ
jgi:hypothetical protein